jgi:hypothetical protein
VRYGEALPQRAEVSRPEQLRAELVVDGEAEVHHLDVVVRPDVADRVGRRHLLDVRHALERLDQRGCVASRRHGLQGGVAGEAGVARSGATFDRCHAGRARRDRR